MSEKTMRATVVKALKPLDAVAIENAARYGTPDVNYVEGWIECKYQRNWPVRPRTPLRVPTFTPKQRAWILRRVARNGNVHVLLKVGNDWHLLPGWWAAGKLGEVTQAEIQAATTSYWRRSLNAEELIHALRTVTAKKLFPTANASGLKGSVGKKTSMKPLNA